MNAKLEAEILNIREDLFNQISTMKSSKDENDKLILEIHKEKVNIRLDLPLRRFTASTDQGHGDEFYFCAKRSSVLPRWPSVVGPGGRSQVESG